VQCSALVIGSCSASMKRISSQAAIFCPHFTWSYRPILALALCTGICSMVSTFALGLLAALAGAPTARACTSAADCSLGGECFAGVCHCYATWKGQNCSELNLLPATATVGKYPAAWARPGVQSSWGGRPLFDNDTGTWHLYAADMTGGVRPQVVEEQLGDRSRRRQQPSRALPVCRPDIDAVGSQPGGPPSPGWRQPHLPHRGWRKPPRVPAVHQLQQRDARTNTAGHRRQR
jgi:hypothetical protein